MTITTDFQDHAAVTLVSACKAVPAEIMTIDGGATPKI